MSIEDRLNIQELNFKYALYVDTFEPDNWAQIFAPDAVLDESAFFADALFAGRDAIRSYGAKIKENVHHIIHLITNHIISDLTATSGRGTAFALVETMRKTGERLRFYVRYDDEYVKIGDSWLIAKRKLDKSLPPEKVTSAT
ncbi:nuclear transport factor 2 family protein [Sphingobium tyrosinilyticum]|uniref:Nuclear transport factor 2 family protein n=1 Tax=Sphingobium tyrosinilyticum TaxID=2715436 RepID=A0ABV9F2M0_9SPHN